MSFPRRPVSTLTAGLLVLVACAGDPERTIDSELGPAGAIPSHVPLAPPGAAQGAAAFGSDAAPATDARTEPGVSAARARKSPMQALNQMVTAQALLVTLLFAPLSKDAADAPLASVDRPPSRTR